MGYYVGKTWRLLEDHIWTTWQVLGDSIRTTLEPLCGRLVTIT